MDIGKTRESEERCRDVIEGTGDLITGGDSPGEGEGLGLAIVTRMLDRHKGKIWVESEPGRGSRLYVRLPAKNGESGT